MSIEKPKQFRCEVVTADVWNGADWDRCFARGVEAAYRKLNDEAMMDGMVIVDQRQALTSFSGEKTIGLCMVLTVQQVSRKDLMTHQAQLDLRTFHNKLGRS